MGVAVPLALGACLSLQAWQWQAVRRWRAGAPWRAWLWRISWCALLVWVASVAWLWVILAGQGAQPQAASQVAAIVVLGSGTQDGQPRAPLALRLDTAAELAALQPQAIVAVTGGVDFGEKESEGIIMARYLARQHGLRQNELVVEEASTSTELNLALARPLLQQRGVDLNKPIAIVTSDFHLWRALRIARRQGYVEPIGIPAPTPLNVRFNAWLREYFAVASSWVLREW